MRMIYTRPTLAMLWLSVICFLTALLAAWYLLQQPWLGVSLRVSDAGDKVLVANTAPHLEQRIPLGAQVLRITSATGNSLALEVSDLIEEPDFFDTYPEMAQFFARQSSLAAMLRAGPVTLAWRDSQGSEGQAVIQPRPRQLPSLPVAFWFQLGVGFMALLIAAWIFLLRPDYWGARLFALTGVTFPFATTSAAIYSSRELALPGEVFRALSSINHGGGDSLWLRLGGLVFDVPQTLCAPTHPALASCCF